LGEVVIKSLPYCTKYGRARRAMRIEDNKIYFKLRNLLAIASIVSFIIAGLTLSIPFLALGAIMLAVALVFIPDYVELFVRRNRESK
jgi:hypothetical protein